MSKQKHAFSKRTVIEVVVAAAIILALIFYFGANGSLQPEIFMVERGKLEQLVSVTGTVKAAEDVDLAFEQSGRVSGVFAEVGDSVRAGEKLIELENDDLNANLAEAQADLAATSARLDELIRGTREEELQIARTKVANSELALSDAEANLAVVSKQAEADLSETLDAAISAAQKGVVVAKDALLTLTDIQQEHFIAFSNQTDYNIAAAKEIAVADLLGESNAGRVVAEFISSFTGGAFGDIHDVFVDSDEELIIERLDQVLSALQKVKLALDSVPFIDEMSSTEKSDLNTKKQGVSTEIQSVSSARQAILSQQAQNSQNITKAEANLNDAQSALALARDELLLKEAGTPSEQVAAQQARVQSARARISNIQSQIRKTILFAPINGVVTALDLTRGELVTPNQIASSLISEADFEVEALVPEIDIAKLRVGDSAVLTLDALGDDIKFNATVVAIDPAETTENGVAKYETTLQFTDNNVLARSGMTAEIDISSLAAEEVLLVPQRAVLEEGGEKFVLVSAPSGETARVRIETGLRDAFGKVEVRSGLNEGQTIIIP